MFINAYEVDLICGPIANQTIEVAQQCYPHLQGLPLADYSQGGEELEVDILIGAVITGQLFKTMWYGGAS